jgi:hypothetical protein
VKNAAELAGVYAMFVVVLAKSNVSDFEAPLSIGQTILDVVGYLFTNLCRVEKLLLDEWVFGFFSKAPILCRLVSEIVRPSGSLNLGPKPTAERNPPLYGGVTLLRVPGLTGALR